MAWSPAQYLRFDDERTRAAMDLLARVPVSEPGKVVDLGCGPGNSTALLRSRWPDAMIVGIDNSADMLAKASESGVDARWVMADIGEWVPEKPVDVIFANASLHWLADHASLIRRLVRGIVHGGCIAIQMPRNFEAPSHTLVRDVALEFLPRSKLGILSEKPVHSPDFYYDILRPHCAVVDIWETEYLHVLRGDNPVLNWVRGTALVPILNELDDEAKAAFLGQCGSALKMAYPARTDGATLFPFRRIFVVAGNRL